MAKRISRMVRKQGGDPKNKDNENIFINAERMMNNTIKRNTINLQHTLEIKQNEFIHEGRGIKDTLFSQAFSDLKDINVESKNFDKKHVVVKKENNIFGEDFSMDENIQDQLLTSYNDNCQKRLSQNINSSKTSINKRLKECLKNELKLFIDDYIEKKHIDNQNLHAMKQTFYELFYSKLLKVLAMIYLFKKEKFFQLLRLDLDDERSQKLYKELEDSYKYYSKNTRELNNEIVQSFILMIIDFESIRQEMKFFMDYHFEIKNDVEKLINLEDSLFFSNKYKSDYQNEAQI